MEASEAVDWANSPALRAELYKLASGRKISEKAAFRTHAALQVESTSRIEKTVGGKYKRYFPTNRHGGNWRLPPIGVVDHYTAGISARSTLIWFSNYQRPPEARQSSAHAVIDFDGTVFLVISLERIAFHAIGFNRTRVGIEHVNPGLLRKSNDGGFLFRESNPLPSDLAKNVSTIGDESWYQYTKKQVTSNIILKRLLVCMYPYSLKRERFTDHQRVDPSRKRDCGPMWPLEKINDFVFTWKSIEGLELPEAAYMTLDAVSALSNSKL